MILPINILAIVNFDLLGGKLTGVFVCAVRKFIYVINGNLSHGVLTGFLKKSVLYEIVIFEITGCKAVITQTLYR